MKRLLLVLLSLGLVLAFSASAMAVDVKFSGDFTIGGMYVDKTRLTKDTYSGDGPSTGFFYQRLRLRTDFVVAPGLSFVTRADIMSRVWGGKRSTNTDNEPLVGSGIYTRPGSTYESENIVFDWAYINYVSPIGLFMVGYMDDNAWGTVFGDSATPAPAIAYVLPIGQFVFIAKYTKGDDNSIHRGSLSMTDARYQHTDYDQDQYVLAGIYHFKAGEIGLLAKYVRAEDTYVSLGDMGRQDGFDITGLGWAPYAKLKFGPVSIQTEVNYFHGAINKLQRHDAAGWGINDYGNGLLGSTKDADVEIDNLAAYIDVLADFKQFYVGGIVAYVSGDDPDTADKKEGGFLNGGIDFNPTLIMWNFDKTYWQGDTYGFNQSGQNGPMGGSTSGADLAGAKFYQIRAGVRPTPAWDIMASLAYAVAAERPGYNAGTKVPKIERFVANDYGYEADLTATYKITSNLSYMLGGGYLWTGDYYKGYNFDSKARVGRGNNDVSNNYLLINKLTLTF